MRTVTMALLSLVALTALEPSARATSVEPKVQLLVRERPSSSARIVDRVPAGRKLQLLGRTADGVWAHVQAPKKDGWVPSEQLKGNVKARKAQPTGDDEGEEVAEEEVRKPLAKRRNVRPEAWVSSSRYHDGEDNKLTISATKAELYGRPQASGSVLGILRRGEVVSLVRKSTDKKWCLVDIGGGDVAWLEAKAVKPGAAKGAPTSVAEQAEQQQEEAPPPPPRGKRAKMVREEVVEEPAQEEQAPPPPKKSKRVAVVEEAPPVEAEEPPPPPPVKKTRKQLAAEAKAALAAEKERAREEQARDAARDDEKAPMPQAAAEVEQPKAKKKRGVRVASRGDISGLSSDSSVSKQRSNHPSNNYFGIGVRAGVAILDQRFTSNGTGPLSNYEASTDAFGLAIGLGYQRAIGKYFRVGLDGGYTFAGAAGVRYHSADGSDPVLAVQTHTIDVGLRAGVHFNVIGGLDLGLRLGGEMQLNLIAASAKVPLPSDRVLGMTIGLSLDLPALFYLANRPFGLHAYGGGLVPADRAQTVGLEEGRASETLGAYFGGGLSYGLFKGLALDALYSYSFAATHFVGQSRRNLTITSADRGSAQHLITLGLSYNL